MRKINDMRLMYTGMSSFGLALLLPFLAAVVLIVRFSFSAEQGVISGFTLDNYRNLLLDEYFLKTTWTTLRLAAISTFITLILSIPIALVMTSVQSAWLRRTITVIILLPMILNLLIQSYGWIMVLGGNGIINKTILAIGLSERPIRLLFNEFSVLVGLVQTTLPLAVFPILAALRGVKKDYLEAATSLGAKPVNIFFDVTLPLLKTGIMGAASIVFAYNASAFAIPLLLGGRKVSMVGTVIRDFISPYFEWANAAAAGVLLIIVTMSIVVVIALWNNWSSMRRGRL